GGRRAPRCDEEQTQREGPVFLVLARSGPATLDSSHTGNRSAFGEPLAIKPETAPATVVKPKPNVAGILPAAPKNWIRACCPRLSRRSKRCHETNLATQHPDAG